MGDMNTITVPKIDRKAELQARLSAVQNDIHERLLDEYGRVTGDMVRPLIAHEWRAIICQVLGHDFGDLDQSDQATITWMVDAGWDASMLAGVLSLLQLAAPRGAIRWNQDRGAWGWTCPAPDCRRGRDGRPFSQSASGFSLAEVAEVRDRHIALDHGPEADR